MEQQKAIVAVEECVLIPVYPRPGAFLQGEWAPTFDKPIHNMAKSEI
jgi:hypothetical protein